MKITSTNASSTKDVENVFDQSRRNFLKTSTGSILMGSTLAATSMTQSSEVMAKNHTNLSRNELRRARQALKKRIVAAENHYKYTLELPAQESNGDDERYRKERFYASFSKTLPHNEFGEVDRSAYRSLRRALRTQNQSDFDAIELSNFAESKLANPQGGYRYVFAGLDGLATRMRPAPAFRSAEAAAEMGEVYWLALTRDVAFTQYDFDPDIDAAVSDLNTFSETVGPKINDLVTPASLFRGNTPGDLAGPYVSQFLWKDVPYGPSLIEQHYNVPLANTDFMTNASEWLNIQRGANPTEEIIFDGTRRYIYNNRSLGEYVHTDVLFQAYFNAALIALGFGADALDDGNPYKTAISNQGSFTSLGGPWAIDLLSQAGNLALAGAWCQKWIIHRRLRPEVYAGRVHYVVNGERSYELHTDVLNSTALDWVYSDHGNYFLPMAFPEGSPTHPSYPAGHATVAGACTTVLKAVFDEDFIIPDPVVANDTGTALNSYIGEDLTLGGEFNKLASNISLGRDAAGVHYRSDGADGLLVGEQQAIALLEDYSIALNEDFGGFNLTKFDGTVIRIINGRTLVDY